MQSRLLLVLTCLVAGAAFAGDVYVTRDAQGRPVYTDKPEMVPAKPVGIHSTDTDRAAVQTQYSEQQQKFAAEEQKRARELADEAEAAKARELKAQDEEHRCAAARERLQAYNDSWRMYDEGPDGERRYMTSEEIDELRARAKRTVDEFCGSAD
jgi:hypothetical protein